jgi:hypothetical protein
VFVARSLAIATAIITALTVPVVVLADSGVDPQASSPAGAVYEIPLQTARDFGSPGGGGSAAHGGGSGGGGVLPTGSAIKSENGYGSSSQVPGLSASAASTAAKQATHAAKAAKATDATSGSGAGAGSAAAASAKAAKAQASAASTPRIDAKRAADEAPSLTGTYGLIILIVLGGAAAGIAASLAARSSFGERSG